MLAIAASGEAPLPGGVRDWLRQTIAQDGARPRVLAALLHGFGADSQIASPVYAGLKACARRHGLDFLSAGTAALPREKQGPVPDARKDFRRVHTPAPMLQDLLYPTARRP
ncbi:MAG: hypothetical protein HZA89_01380 [Verrucomicrobia bacterium]|nr:hypothetical protein [Verrucomicrobiota bacterium]